LFYRAVLVLFAARAYHQIVYEAFRTYYSVGKEIERQKCDKEKQQISKTNKKDIVM